MGEVRVSLIVKNHETGVDWHWSARSDFRHRDGIGVAAGIVVLLEKGEIEMMLQKMRATHPCNPGADDG